MGTALIADQEVVLGLVLYNHMANMGQFTSEVSHKWSYSIPTFEINIR
jgi:hypothetical protein